MGAVLPGDMRRLIKPTIVRSRSSAAVRCSASVPATGGSQGVEVNLMISHAAIAGGIKDA